MATSRHSSGLREPATFQLIVDRAPIVSATCSHCSFWRLERSQDFPSPLKLFELPRNLCRTHVRSFQRRVDILFSRVIRSTAASLPPRRLNDGFFTACHVSFTDDVTVPISDMAARQSAVCVFRHEPPNPLRARAVHLSAMGGRRGRGGRSGGGGDLWDFMVSSW